MYTIALYLQIFGVKVDGDFMYMCGMECDSLCTPVNEFNILFVQYECLVDDTLFNICLHREWFKIMLRILENQKSYVWFVQDNIKNYCSDNLLYWTSFKFQDKYLDNLVLLSSRKLMNRRLFILQPKGIKDELEKIYFRYKKL